MKLRYVIKFVADMDKAVAFNRDVLGLTLGFQSPEWSEFDTGETRIALHIASEKNPAGKIELGFNTDDLDAFYATRTAMGVEFTLPPTQEKWQRIAQLVDCDGAQVTVGG